jgi:hypothetical protein
VLLHAEAGLSFNHHDHGIEVAPIKFHRPIAPLADDVMAVVVRLVAARLVLSAGEAQRIDVAAFSQVQLAHQSQRKQQIQRAVDGDQPQRRMVRAAARQQFSATGLSARLADRHQHGLPRTRVRVAGLRQGIQQRDGGRRCCGCSLGCMGRKSKITFIFHPLILAAGDVKVKSAVSGGRARWRAEEKARYFKLRLLTRPAVRAIYEALKVLS